MESILENIVAELPSLCGKSLPDTFLAPGSVRKKPSAARLSTASEESDATSVSYYEPRALVLASDRKGDGYAGPPLPDNAHIRLVELWHSAPGIVFRRFRSGPLESAPDFYALSWGRKSETTIPTPGMRIIDSLSSALSNLAEGHSKLWGIDALSINQDDVEEKNEQVKLMCKIYSKAKKVYAWLGKPDIASLNLLQKIATRIGTEKLFDVKAVFAKKTLKRYGLPGI